jgi:hypothetical protein
MRDPHEHVPKFITPQREPRARRRREQTGRHHAALHPELVDDITPGCPNDGTAAGMLIDGLVPDRHGSLRSRCAFQFGRVPVCRRMGRKRVRILGLCWRGWRGRTRRVRFGGCGVRKIGPKDERGGEEHATAECGHRIASTLPIAEEHLPAGFKGASEDVEGDELFPSARGEHVSSGQQDVVLAASPARRVAAIVDGSAIDRHLAERVTNAADVAHWRGSVIYVSVRRSGAHIGRMPAGRRVVFNSAVRPSTQRDKESSSVSCLILRGSGTQGRELIHALPNGLARTLPAITERGPSRQILLPLLDERTDRGQGHRRVGGCAHRRFPISRSRLCRSFGDIRAN